jgi:uncharacterized protein (TIGR02231 family)
LANAPGEAELEISYLVGNAGWRPTYDLRAASDLKSADLLLSAVVAQRTGEDWTDVNLTFSTSKPERGAQPPKPEPMVLSVQAPAPLEQLKAVGYNAGRAERSRERRIAAADDKAGLALGADAEAIALPVDAQVFASGLSTQLRVPRAESVPADNRPHRVRVAEASFKLEPTHLVVPRLATRAFVQAKPKNTAPFPVLAGLAQVFVGNDFVGKIALAETPVGEPLELALGADPGITVERRQEKADREGPGFLGSRVRWTYQYRIAVKNVSAATGAATFEVAETIPISRDDRIKVEVTSSEPPFLRGAKEDRERETQGLLRWRLPAAPGEERVIQLTYVVSAPEDLRIDGLER